MKKEYKRFMNWNDWKRIDKKRKLKEKEEKEQEKKVQKEKALRESIRLNNEQKSVPKRNPPVSSISINSCMNDRCHPWLMTVSWICLGS